MADKDAQRGQRDTLLSLLRGLDYYRAWRLSKLRLERPDMAQSELEAKVVMSGAVYLQLFDDSNGKGRAAIIKEVRAWYSHTASDLEYFANLSTSDREEVQNFLKGFHSNVGFRFHQAAGCLQKLATKVLKRDGIENEQEFYLLHELTTDLSQTVLSGEELSEVGRLLRAFEEGRGGGEGLP